MTADDRLDSLSLAALVDGVQAAWADPDQPRATLQAAGAAFQQTVGFKLYSVLLTLPGERETTRIHTSDPATYPVGGRKPIVADAYGARVRGEMKPFLGRTMAEIAPLFADHETMARLGLGSVINVPVVYRGKVLGTVNLVAAEGHYDDVSVGPATAIARQILPVLIDLSERTAKEQR